MRLTLTPNPLQLVAEEAVDETAGAAPRRRVAGLAVPYEVEARVGAQMVTFAPSSVTISGRSPLLLGHDPNRPVGVLAASSESELGLRAEYAIDATSDGDTALVQASSGSRSGLSVGVDVVRFDQDPDDETRIRVVEAQLAETSLVALAAYPGASVDTIAAHNTGGTMPEHPTPDTRDPAEAPERVEAGDAERELAHDAPRRPAMIIAERNMPEMRLGEYIQTLVRAERGDAGARQRIEAALTRSAIGTNPGVVPITYVQELVDGLGDERPLFNSVSHAEMPPAGMTIRRPVIATRPDGAFIADDTAGAPSGAVAINNLDVSIKQWAWGGSASVALVERSAPSYVEEVFSQAIKSYHRDAEADIAGFFPAATGGPATLGAAVAAFLAAYRRYPTRLYCGGAAYGKLLEAVGVLTFASGSADAQGTANVAGLQVIASPDLAAGDAWVTASDFLEVRESAPLRLSVSDVTSLSLEIGVTSFYSCVRTLPTSGTVAGAVGIPGYTPAAAAAATASKSSK